ncbi:radical SAM protein [Candidatus Riflebacteria bacterium]
MHCNIQFLNLNPTYQCTSECHHCRYFCSFQTGAEEYMTAECLNEILNQLESHPLMAVCIGGGEPLLNRNALYESILVIKSRKNIAVHLITNGFWGTTYENALDIAKELKSINLDSVTVSSDAYHQMFIPLNNVKNSLKALIKARIPVVSSGGSFTGIESLALKYDLVTKANLKQLEHIQKVRVEGDGLISLVGRAADKLANKALTTDTVHDLNCCLKPWDGGDFFNLTAITVDTYGYISTCAGIPLGNFRQKKLREILTDYHPESHAIINIIVKQGPAGLKELALKNGFKPRKKYLSGCHLCFESRRFLKKSIFKDILKPDICYESQKKNE